jgi:hypothetical protein
MGARSANAGPRNAGILTAENGLHGDHCGGNRLSPGTPIYVQRRELDDACSDESWRRLSPLAEAVDVVPSISRDREPVTPRETRNTSAVECSRILVAAFHPTPKLRPGPCATRSRSQRGSMSSRWT